MILILQKVAFVTYFHQLRSTCGVKMCVSLVNRCFHVENILNIKHRSTSFNIVSKCFQSVPKGPNCNGHGHGAAPLVRPVIGLRGHRRGRLRLHGAAPTFEATLPGRGGVWMVYGWLGRMARAYAPGVPSPVAMCCKLGSRRNL